MNVHNLIVVLKGAATYIPGLYRPRWGRPEGTVLVRYCYSVWLRHLVMAWRNGFRRVPGSVAELGPGASFGTGLAAILSGADAYAGLDVVAYADPARNEKHLDELLELFRRREPIPDNKEFPLVRPLLDSYEFPRDILTEAVLTRTLDDERVRAVRAALRAPPAGQTHGIRIAYFVPWHDADVIRPESVDMVFSQAVLEYVDDLDSTYRAMRLWLRPGGLMSHTIGLDCHGTAAAWDGHWAYPAWLWRIVRGRREAFINRLPYSAHRACLDRLGLRVIGEQRSKRPPATPRDRLARPFRDLDEQDLTTAAAFVQAIKGPYSASAAPRQGRGA